MKVLVTGGTGFLGKRLAGKLKQLNYEVTVLGRNTIIGKQLASEGLNFIPVDLQNPQATIAACQKQDYIFHCAALSSPWGKYQDFYNANVIGTKNIIQACQTHQIKRLIHISTTAVYFDFTHRFNIKENSPLPSKPANHYAKTKLLAETEINQATKQGLPAIIIRPRGIFGPGDTAILPRLIRASQSFGIPFINDGQACIDITYIDNVVDALLLCKDAPDKSLGKIFNISNDEPMKLAKILRMLFSKLDFPLKTKRFSYPTAYGLATILENLGKIMGKEPLLTRYTVGLLAFSQTLDISAAKEELGYQPSISIEEGLNRFVSFHTTI
ncbi:MAG: NAD(P)-dependent oxidoreductase [Oscillatoria sp. PMC 1051.18]|nr:NAD(P)-dependent oxidoreductase [Oscillatoria sp. PMC 1050.18]MEC5031573.1 NAD(P)-dependent oxidoreductase [Oscillatoria sp. PMC 1051.18]